MAAVTAEKIMQALAEIMAPAGAKVAGLSVEGGRVLLSLEIDASNKVLAPGLQEAAEKALQKIPGIEKAAVIVTAEKNMPPAAPSAARGGHAVSKRPVAPDVKHIIAVASGKGGVGKSTVAANLALAFAAMGKKAGLLDADIYGASQPRMMGLRARPESDDSDMIIPLAAHGVKFISMGLFVGEGEPLVWRGPMVHSALQQLFRDVAWGALDVLVVDLPPGTGDVQLSLAQNVKMSGAIIVSTPQDVALSEAKKGLAMFQKVNVPILGVVENMSYHLCQNCGHREDIFSHGGAVAAAAEMSVPFLGEIPLVTAVRRAADVGVPIVAASPQHPAAEAFKNIAARVWVAL